MEKEDLLKQVWETCTLDEILQCGLENNQISSSDIINEASIYNDPNKEYSDDEIEEIIKEADLEVVINALNKKYSTNEILENFDEDDILSIFDSDKVFDYFSWDLDSIVQDEKDSAWSAGYDAATQDYSFNEKNYLERLHNGNQDTMWCWLCNYFDLTYRDNVSLYKKLNELIKSLNKSTYKDKNEPQWISINLDR